MESKISIPLDGEKISINSNLKLDVPNNPIIPFICGDGIGSDITPAMQAVVDKATLKAYGNSKKIAWMEVFAGEKATKIYGEGIYLPDETIDALKSFVVSIKGPLATPVGGGIRSLNVALRQSLDLYVCLRPIRYYQGVPSPVKNPQNVNMVIFRENTEDIYAGIEYENSSDKAKKIIELLDEFGDKNKIRFPNSAAIGIKPVSKEGSQRLIRKAIEYAINNNRKSVTIVHKGNIMKFTEGGFKEWGYEVAKKEFNAKVNDLGFYEIPTNQKIDAINKKIVVKDMITDAFLQEVLLNPKDHDVVATLNLNGDYASDALAAQVGGIGISPGANMSDGASIFEATHGTAPKYAGLDKVNPSSVILSGVMMLEYMGWQEAADLIVKGIEGAINAKRVTYDFNRLMDGATELKCSEFGQEIISNMN